MTTEADTARYVKITHAHHMLAAIGEDARRLHALADSHPFDDGADLARPVHDALAMHLAAAGKAATGIGAPLDPRAVDADYAAALADALDTITSTATVIANRARAVRNALDAGLITDPRVWTADGINSGAMLEALAPVDTGNDSYEWYEFDAMFMAGCIDALNRERLADTITADVYDRHMARLVAVADVVGPTPEGIAGHVTEALTQWREDDDEASHALDAPTAPLPARHAINGAKTYARLRSFAKGLTGAAWDDKRRDAHKHMKSLAKHAHSMGADAHGKGREDAADLFEFINEWRMNAYAENIDTARAFRDIDNDDVDDAYFAAEETAYYALYLAADLATSTGQLLDVWRLASTLTDDHEANIRVGVIMLFEESRTGTGAPLVDAGSFAEHTRGLRAAVDAHPLPEMSNVAHTVNYRNLRKAIDAIDPRAPMSDNGLVKGWGHVVRNADNGDITRRQVAELRRLVNAKVAEYGDGNEAKTAAMAARLPEWDRITDELNA